MPADDGPKVDRIRCQRRTEMKSAMNDKDSGPRVSRKGDGVQIPQRTSGPMKTIKSVEILADAQEVIIEHEGDQYRLRQTSKGKLILTK